MESNLSYEKISKLEARMRGGSARPLHRESLDSDGEDRGGTRGGHRTGAQLPGSSPTTTNPQAGGARRGAAGNGADSQEPLDEQTRSSLQVTEEIPASPPDRRKSKGGTTAAQSSKEPVAANAGGAAVAGAGRPQAAAQKRKAGEEASGAPSAKAVPSTSGRVLDFGNAPATGHGAKTTPPRGSAGAASKAARGPQQKSLDGFLTNMAAVQPSPMSVQEAPGGGSAVPHQQAGNEEGGTPRLGEPLPRTYSGAVGTEGTRAVGTGSPLVKDDTPTSLTILGYQKQLNTLRQQLESQRRQFESQLEALGQERAKVEAALKAKEEELAQARQDARAGAEGHEAKDRWCDAARDLVTRLSRRAAVAERTRTAQEIAQKKGTLGTFGVQRMGTRVFDTWMEGFEFQVKRQRLREIEAEKAEIEQQRKELKKQAGKAGAGAVSDDVLKGKVETLKKEEKRLGEALEELEAEKKAFIREMKRFNDESESEYQNCPKLGDRYILTRLLGRGGFSEVFRAVDLQEMCEVAVKVHKVEAGWTNQRKMDYIRHTVREYEIHKSLRHHRIAQLVDTFEIDCNTFATVMELCDGGDLDQTLRTYGHLSEKEARNIVYQVLEGLVYLNNPGANKPRVIHYDLKPANILFTNLMEVKISDFGLSKSYEDGQTLAGVEMTSPGAGTYWYLPPECFNLSSMQAARVSNKVDVWSVGVILYQMIYGKRPFGDDQTQQDLMLNNTITVQAQRGVVFPTTPKISQEAKDFISKCLTFNAAQRPDVVQAFADPFFNKK